VRFALCKGRVCRPLCPIYKPANFDFRMLVALLRTYYRKLQYFEPGAGSASILDLSFCCKSSLLVQKPGLWRQFAHANPGSPFGLDLGCTNSAHADTSHTRGSSYHTALDMVDDLVCLIFVLRTVVTKGSARVRGVRVCPRVRGVRVCVKAQEQSPRISFPGNAS
jgi:hypothetical protein